MTEEKCIALIGVGPMAAQHAQAISHVKGLDIVSCASRSLDKAENFAAENGIPSPRLFEEVVAKPDADALWVVAPAHVMAPLASDLNGLGLPLFLEKPVGLSLEETMRVRDAVDVPNMVGLNRRFYEVIQRGREIIDAAGGARAVEVHMPEDLSRVPSGVHADETLQQWQFANSVHLLDLFRFFAGDPVRIQSTNQVLDVGDRSYNALIDFDTGARGVFHAQWYAPGGWRVAVYGNDVCVVFQPIERMTVFRKGEPPKTVDPAGPDASVKAGLAGQATAFLDLLRTGRLASGAADLQDYAKSVSLVASLTAAN